MNNKALPTELIERYLAHACTDAERRLVDEWYRQLDFELDEPNYAFDEEGLLKRIRIELEAVEKEEEMDEPVPIVWEWRLGRIAAVIAVALGVIWLVVVNKKSEPTASPAVATIPTAVESETAFTNREKRIVRYQLPDKSQVWLNPEARISHPRSFEGLPTREVKFVGEAFFEVTHDLRHPFVIYSGKLKTEVLGTSFNIKAYENDPVYQVSVVTGRVAVSSSEPSGEGQKAKILLPREQITFEKNSNNLVTEVIAQNEEKHQNWEPVTLIFDNAPMSEVASRLEKTFQVKIDISGSDLRNCRLKIDFNNQRLPEILDIINTLLGTTYEMDGERVAILGKGC